MSAVSNIPGTNNYVLQAAIGAYADEAYTNARKLVGTGLVSSNPDVDTKTETFVGQMRWRRPINQVINTASLTDSTRGALSTYGKAMLNYIKTVRTHGAEDVNMTEVITQENGLAKFGRDLAETRTQDEHNAILAVMKGVAISELLYGAGNASGSAGLGGQTFENDPASLRHGFYVDLGANKPVVPASAAQQGAARAEGFLNALGMAFKDYEPAYAYLVTSPETMASLRSANLVDTDKVTDGEIEFSTIFQGKLRLIQTRANQGLTPSELAKINTGAGIDLVGTKTSFIVLPGNVSMNPLSVPKPVGIDEDEGAYQGGGSTSVWYRWGYVAHPAGYSWEGSKEAFPTDANYMGLRLQNGTLTTLAAAANVTDLRGVWDRRFSSALALGILPVFHN